MIHNKYFEIMKQFLKGYNKEIYGRELVGKVNLSQKGIALTLSEMEKRGILVSKTKGNIRHYFLNKQNNLINNYILMFEIEKAIEFLDKYPKIAEIFNELDVKGIICIFGSYVKGIEKKGSDLDLFVVGKFDKKKVRQVGKTFGMEINVQSGTMKDFISSLKEGDLLVNEILEHHVIIQGFERFVNEVIKQKW